MPVPVDDLRKLLRSESPDATLVLVEGRYVVADREELTTDALRGALSVVTREELLRSVGGEPATDRDLDQAAAVLSSAVDNRGG